MILSAHRLPGTRHNPTPFQANPTPLQASPTPLQASPTPLVLLASPTLLLVNHSHNLKKEGRHKRRLRMTEVATVLE